ncbi:MAG: type II secretion system protein N, partial [Panacagrimonas sp.]
MKPGKLILIGVVVFVSTLIWQAPVAHLYGWVMGDRPSAVIARGLSGTPWNGQAAAISLDGKTVAQSLQWQFRPVQLLLGRFAVGIQSAADPIFSGELHLNFFGPISLHEVRAGGSIAELLSYFPNAALPADGQ